MDNFKIEVTEADEKDLENFCKFRTFSIEDLNEYMKTNNLRLLKSVIKSDGLQDFKNVGMAVKETDELFIKESVRMFKKYFKVLQNDDRYSYSKHKITADLIEEILNDLEKALALPDGPWKKYYHYDLEFLRHCWIENFSKYKLDGDEILNYWGKWQNNGPKLFWIHHHVKEAFEKFDYFNEEKASKNV